MKKFTYLIFIFQITLSTFSFAGEFDDINFTPNLSQENFDPLDQIVVSLEQQRLISRINGESFLPLYFNSTLQLVTENESIDFKVIEQYQRKWNTGMNLIALPVDEVEKHLGIKSFCASPISGEDEVTHILYLENGDPATALNMLNELEISSDDNLENLINVGVIIMCEGNLS